MRTPRSSLAACLVGLLAPLLTTGLATGLASGPSAPAGADVSGPGPDPDPSVSQVLVVSLDGLNPQALARLGRRGTPVLHRLMRSGASTLDARSAREETLTLPNHTGMVTGLRIDAARGGHGVFWNDERVLPATVQEAAGRPVESVFDVVHAAGLTTSFFAAKAKFSLWDRSWPRAISTSAIADGDDAATERAARAHLADGPRGLTFVHLGGADHEGHESGFMTADYLRAVRVVDRRLGRILVTLRDSGLAGETMVVVTSDHGGVPPNHFDETRLGNYRVPFFVRGPAVPAGVDLYDLNPDYREPGNRRTGYAAARQPIRNGDVANLVTDVLGLRALSGSEHDAAQDLDVFDTP